MNTKAELRHKEIVNGERLQADQVVAIIAYKHLIKDYFLANNLKIEDSELAARMVLNAMDKTEIGFLLHGHNGESIKSQDIIKKVSDPKFSKSFIDKVQTYISLPEKLVAILYEEYVRQKVTLGIKVELMRKLPTLEEQAKFCEEYIDHHIDLKARLKVVMSSFKHRLNSSTGEEALLPKLKQSLTYIIGGQSAILREHEQNKNKKNPFQKVTTAIEHMRGHIENSLNATTNKNKPKI